LELWSQCFPEQRPLEGGSGDAQRFIAAADFVLVAMPLTSETRGYFDAERLSWLKPSAYLINVGPR
jgi:lactate dehydrogenase-like 2-hydroxyacid dehydrogenase